MCLDKRTNKSFSKNKTKGDSSFLETHFPLHIAPLWLLVTLVDGSSPFPTEATSARERTGKSRYGFIVLSDSGVRNILLSHISLVKARLLETKSVREVGNGNQLCPLRSPTWKHYPTPRKTSLTRLRQFYRELFRYRQDRFHCITCKWIPCQFCSLLIVTGRTSTVSRAVLL